MYSLSLHVYFFDIVYEADTILQILRPVLVQWNVRHTEALRPRRKRGQLGKLGKFGNFFPIFPRPTFRISPVPNSKTRTKFSAFSKTRTKFSAFSKARKIFSNFSKTRKIFSNLLKTQIQLSWAFPRTPGRAGTFYDIFLLIFVWFQYFFTLNVLEQCLNIWQDSKTLLQKVAGNEHEYEHEHDFHGTFKELIRNLEYAKSHNSKKLLVLEWILSFLCYLIMNLTVLFAFQWYSEVIIFLQPCPQNLLSYFRMRPNMTKALGIRLYFFLAMTVLILPSFWLTRLCCH